MRLLPKSIHWCRRYPTKFNSGRDIPPSRVERELTAEGLVVRLPPRRYGAKAFNLETTDRLRVVLRVEQESRFSVDTVDLYAARSRREYAKRAAARLSADIETIDEELLTVMSELEAHRDELREQNAEKTTPVEAMSDSDRA